MTETQYLATVLMNTSGLFLVLGLAIGGLLVASHFYDTHDDEGK